MMVQCQNFPHLVEQNLWQTCITFSRNNNYHFHIDRKLGLAFPLNQVTWHGGTNDLMESMEEYANCNLSTWTLFSQGIDHHPQLIGQSSKVTPPISTWIEEMAVSLAKDGVDSQSEQANLKLTLEPLSSTLQ